MGEYLVKGWIDLTQAFKSIDQLEGESEEITKGMNLSKRSKLVATEQNLCWNTMDVIRR